MRSFKRPLGQRRYKKLFVVSVEGFKTEPQYFALFNQPDSIVLVKCLKKPSNESSPMQVLKRMEVHLRKESLKKSDEAWIVVDKDGWIEDHLLVLMKWAKKSPNYGVAISAPSFEYWLLLHFEDGKGLSSAQECLTRLKRYLPNYNKDIDGKKITAERISQAIERAKQRHRNSNNNLSSLWSSTVYKLVERILTHK